MARKAPPPRLYVLAGINGAGKSSIGGAMIRASGADYFNPDEAARDLIAANPGLDQVRANAAASQGFEVRVWYVGLASADLHIERVRNRVRAGGHDIPQSSIRRRWRHSRLNLVQLLPHLTELRVYDNSADADPAAGNAPRPVLVLHLDHGEIVGPPDLSSTPEWAKPIVAAALKLA